MFFKYDTVIDVKKVTEYTIKNMQEGKTYFFATTVYDDDKNESLFSIELTHYVPVTAPAEPQVLRFKIQPPTELEIIDNVGFRIIPEHGLSDPIKEIEEEK